jgi:hypothetical protein
MPMAAPWPETAEARAVPELPPVMPPGGNVAGPPYRSPDELDPLTRVRSQPPQPAIRGRQIAASNPPSPAIEASQLSESIPRRLSVGLTLPAEVRIAHGLGPSGRTAGPPTGPPAARREAGAHQVFSVRLRAPRGGLRIEPASPETLWIEPQAGRLSADVAVWRFNLAAERPGTAEVSLAISARMIGPDGTIHETTLPERGIAIRVGRNWKATLTRWGVLLSSVVAALAAEEGLEEFLNVDLFRLVKGLVGL